MDFFEQQAHARRQTRLLILLFAVALLAVLVLNYLFWATIIQPFLKPVPHTARQYGFLVTIFLMIGELFVHPIDFLKWLWDSRLAGWIVLGTFVSVALGCAYKIYFLSSGGPAVAEMLGGRRVNTDTSDPDERRLRNVVEEMAIASGMPVPEIYVLDRERGLNTFAAGHTREDVAIGVTFACLKLLNRDELQGIIAHEFSHVLNGDTRLNMRLMALVHGLFWPTLVGRLLLRGTTRAPEIGDSILFDQQERPTIYLPLIPLSLVFYAIGSLGLPFVRWIKSAICREREWLADSAAIQFTRNPAGIEGALKKVGGLLKQGRLDTPFAETASHLYFVNSVHDPWFSFQSTHPPLIKRIAAIDPTFNGQFQHIRSLPSRDAEYDRLYEQSVRKARIDAHAHPETWSES